MVKRNSAGQDYTNNADGFTLGGGSTQRNLSLTGADVTITGSGSNTYNFPSSSDTLVGRDSTDTLKNKDLTDSSNTLPAVDLSTATGTLPVAHGGTGNTSGLAASATKLATARTIGGVSFDGTANINLPGVNTTGNQNTTGSAASLTTARSLQVSLSSSSAQTFNGTANATSIGVSGSLPLTSLAAGYVKGSNNGTPTTMTLWKGTLSQYNALGTYDSNTVYVIT